MRQYGLFVLLAFVGIILQMTLLGSVIRPDIAFLVVVYLGLNRSFGRSIPAVLIIGYLTDVFSGLPDGTFLLVYLVCFCLAQASTLVFYFRGAIFPVVVATSLALFYMMLLALLWIVGQSRPLSESGLELGYAMTFVLVNGLSAVVLFRIFRWVDERFTDTPMSIRSTNRKTITHVLAGD